MTQPTESRPDWLQHSCEEICRVGQSLFARGYVHATAGNISVRVPEDVGGGLLITPTDACLGFVRPEDIVWVDARGRIRAGERPSKTAELHRSIYAAAEHARCVIHTHSTHLVALSLQTPGEEGADLLPPITPYFVMKVGHVPRVPYHRPGDPQVAEKVGHILRRAAEQGRRLHAVMLDRLGPNVWHDSPGSAMAVLEELEETARLWLLTGPRAPHPPAELTEGQIQELRQQFRAPW